MTRGRGIAAGCAVALAAIAAAAYAPSTGFPFVRYDDDIRLLANLPVRGGLSGDGLAWAFGATWDGNWSPVTWISHMLDFTLYASDAGGHHGMNVFLHALNAVLLFFALRSASGAPLRSAMVALLFAVHPIHVETVAWVSERKGLLAATFGLAALWAHAAGARRGELRVLALLLFALGLMAKPVVVVLPFVALLLDRLRLASGNSTREAPAPRLLAQALALWPWFLLAAASAAITLAANAEAVRSAASPSVGSRIANALVTSVVYLGKLAWPVHLAPFYPHPDLPGGTPWSALQIAGALGVWLVLGLLAWRSGHRVLRIGLAWYAVCLLPVSGLLQVGAQAMADRYAYLPAIGVYLAVVWGAASLLRGRGRAVALPAAAVAALAVLALLVVQQRQLPVWRSSEVLFRHTLAVTDANFVMHFNLANVLKRRGRVEEAIEHYRAAVAINPGLARAHFNLANTLLAEERPAEAIDHYRAAIAAQPDLEPARESLGRLLIRQGDLPGAIAHFAEAVRRNPESASARITYAHLQRMAGDLRGAAASYEIAAALAADGSRWREEARAMRALAAETRAAE